MAGLAALLEHVCNSLYKLAVALCPMISAVYPNILLLRFVSKLRQVSNKMVM